MSLQNSPLIWSTLRDREIEVVDDLMDGNKFISSTYLQKKYRLPFKQLRNLVQTFNLRSFGQEINLEELISNSETDNK